MEKKPALRISFVPIAEQTCLSHKSHADVKDDHERVRVLDQAVQVEAFGAPFQEPSSLLASEYYGTSTGGGQASSF